ncbi:MAG: hypothetical protein JWM80_6689, partial [Cyanobacteria bacterium RYN_339]|nr:hypothetical protein [Cyanobacteria bacterium RYN_339]
VAVGAAVDPAVGAAVGPVLACGFTVEGVTHAETTPSVHAAAMPIRKYVLLPTATLYPGTTKVGLARRSDAARPTVVCCPGRRVS